MAAYRFYGWESADIRDERGLTPREYYDLLSEIWCAETCAPRMRMDWSEDNRTLGQCSITSFLVQDIFGGSHSIYGTAGGVYPVQISVSINGDITEGIPAGVYYFDQRKNTLVMTDYGSDAFGRICVEGNRPIAGNAAAAMLFVSEMSVIEPLYGSRSRDFCLIECGLIAQALESICADNGLVTCQIGS